MTSGNLQDTLVKRWGATNHQAKCSNYQTDFQADFINFGETEAMVWRLQVDKSIQHKNIARSLVYISGWWFGTSLLFFHILGIIIPTD